MSKNAAGTQYDHQDGNTMTLGGPVPVGSPVLASTGFDLAPLFLIGGLLIVVGLAFLRSIQGDKRMTIRRIFTGGSVLMVSLVMAAPASAAGIDNGIHIANAYNAAVVTWKPNHCPNRDVALWSFNNQTFDDLPPNVIAFAYIGQCDIYFNIDHSFNHQRILFSNVMVHEMGHVAYRGHNTDRTDIMYPYMSEYGPHWGGNFLVSGDLQQRMKRYGHVFDYSIAHNGREIRSSSADIRSGTPRQIRATQRAATRIR